MHKCFRGNCTCLKCAIIKLLMLNFGHWHREKFKALGIVIYALCYEPLRAHIDDFY